MVIQPRKLPDQISDLILQHGFDGDRTLPKCMFKARTSPKLAAPHCNVFTHPLLSVNRRLREQTLDCITRNCAFVEVRVYGQNSRSSQFLNLAKEHGRLVYPSWSENAVIKPSVLIIVEGPEYRLRPKYLMKQPKVLTILCDPHTLGTLLSQIYWGNFNHIGDNPTKFEMTILAVGPSCHKFEIETILQTFNGVSRKEPMAETMIWYAPSYLDPDIQDWLDSDTMIFSHDEHWFVKIWNISAKLFLVGIESLLSRNRNNAAKAFIVSCACHLRQTPSYHLYALDYRNDDLEDPEWHRNERLRVLATIVRVNWQLHCLASLACFDLSDCFPHYAANHDVQRFGKSDLDYAYPYDSRLLYDNRVPFGLSADDEANFHYVQAAIRLLQLQRDFNTTGTILPTHRDKSEFVFAYQRLLWACYIVPDNKLYTTELSECIAMDEEGLETYSENHKNLLTISYIDADFDMRMGRGRRVKLADESRPYLQRAHKLVYGTDLDRFDRIIKLLDGFEIAKAQGQADSLIATSNLRYKFRLYVSFCVGMSLEPVIRINVGGHDHRLR